MSALPVGPKAARAVVFAYHDVGVRCLQVLLDAGVDVALVVTHVDDPAETRWFASVADLAAARRLRCVAPSDPHIPALIDTARSLAPDFLFSFYYRQMLRREWLTVPRRGAFNLHGSLLPHYRGRAPVNWAVLHGERETGATLHRMNEKPDHGAIVDQQAVPIRENDTAHEVFGKVVEAAVVVLSRSLPHLIDGSAVETPQDLAKGSYFGGRRPQDGRIPADASAAQVHDLVRALAPPYPPAFLFLAGQRVFIERTRHAPEAPTPPGQGLRLLAEREALWLVCADGGVLQVLAARADGSDEVLDAPRFERRFNRFLVTADA